MDEVKWKNYIIYYLLIIAFWGIVSLSSRSHNCFLGFWIKPLPFWLCIWILQMTSNQYVCATLLPGMYCLYLLSILHFPRDWKSKREKTSPGLGGKKDDPHKTGKIPELPNGQSVPGFVGYICMLMLCCKGVFINSPEQQTNRVQPVSALCKQRDERCHKVAFIE